MPLEKRHDVAAGSSTKMECSRSVKTRTTGNVHAKRRCTRRMDSSWHLVLRWFLERFKNVPCFCCPRADELCLPAPQQARGQCDGVGARTTHVPIRTHAHACVCCLKTPDEELPGAGDDKPSLFPLATVAQLVQRHVMQPRTCWRCHRDSRISSRSSQKIPTRFLSRDHLSLRGREDSKELRRHAHGCLWPTPSRACLPAQPHTFVKTEGNWALIISCPLTRVRLPVFTNVRTVCKFLCVCVGALPCPQRTSCCLCSVATAVARAEARARTGGIADVTRCSGP